jgi:hypothetical protein
MSVHPLGEARERRYFSQVMHQLVAVLAQQREIFTAVVLVVAVQVQVMDGNLPGWTAAITYFAAALALLPKINPGLTVLASQVCDALVFKLLRVIKNLSVVVTDRGAVFRAVLEAHRERRVFDRAVALLAQPGAVSRSPLLAHALGLLRQTFLAVLPVGFYRTAAVTADASIDTQDPVDGLVVVAQFAGGGESIPEACIRRHDQVSVSRCAGRHTDEFTVEV